MCYPIKSFSQLPAALLHRIGANRTIRRLADISAAR